MESYKKYNCLKTNNFTFANYSLDTIQHIHIEKIRIWRNSQINVLRQKEAISIKEQELYFKNIVWPEMEKDQPKQILFSFFYKSQLIGYGGLTNISWIDKRTELSFLVNNLRADKKDLYSKDFHSFLNLIKKVTFSVLDFNRLFTETYDIRDDHLKILENNGFIFEGRLIDHNFINGKYVDSLMHGFLKKDYLN